MTVPTVPVTVRLADFGGPSVAGVTIKARQSDVDYTSTGTFVSTEPVTAVTDATGTAVLNVFPNAVDTGLGTRGTTVLFTASIPSSRPLRVEARVPNVASNLVNILVPLGDVPLTDAELALLQVQAAAAEADTDAAAAAASATAAEASRDAIDDRIYPGTYSSPPTTRPDGTAIQTADIHFTTAGTPMVFRSGAWQVLVAADSTALAAATGSTLVGHDLSTVAKSIQALQEDMVGRGKLLRFWRKMRSIYDDGAIAQVGVFTAGDSVRGYPVLGLIPLLSATIGTAGCALDPTGTAPAALYGTAGDVIVPASNDNTYWPTGIHYDIGVGGVVTITVGGGVFVGTKFAAYFAKRSGGGTVKLELLDGSNVVTDTIASFDTANASVAFGKSEFTLGAAIGRKIRVTGLTGRSILVGSKFLNDTVAGVVWSSIGRGGLFMGSPGWMDAAPAVWEGCIADLHPDLAMYCAREDQGSVFTSLTTMLTRYNVGYASSDWVLSGQWPAGASPGIWDFGLPLLQQPSFLEGEEIRNVADNFGYQFFQPYFLFSNASGAIKKEVPSDVHLTTADSLIYAAAFLQQLGFVIQANGRTHTVRGVATDSYTSPKFVSRTAGLGVTDPSNAEFDAIGTVDANLNFQRTLKVFGKAMDGVSTPVLMAQFEGSATTPGTMLQGYNSSTAARNITAFDIDGKWALVDDGGGGVFLRWRKAGVLKEASLQLADPGVDGSGNINNSKGIGWTGKLYLSTDSGFTSTTEYANEQFRVARDVNTGDLLVNFQGATFRSVIPLPGTGAMRFVSTVTANALPAAVNFDVGTNTEEYRTSNAPLNFTVNFRWSGTVTLDTAMVVNRSMTVRHYITNGATAFRPTAWTIDGVAVTPKWLGGTAPAAGNVNSVDVYTYRIVKSAAATFTVFASQEKYA